MSGMLGDGSSSGGGTTMSLPQMPVSMNSAMMANAAAMAQAGANGAAQAQWLQMVPTSSGHNQSKWIGINIRTFNR